MATLATMATAATLATLPGQTVFVLATLGHPVARRGSRQASILDTVEEYRDQGWSPVPLPYGQKWPPPKGYTGANHLVPNHRDYARWERSREWGNLALVMPEGVIGYDVDVYHGGHLPDDLPVTVRSTSRDDGSGISLFRVAADVKLRGDDGHGVEIIQNHHRYAVAWPSVHPDGPRYRWLWPNDRRAEIPAVDELPELPKVHLKRLLEPRKTYGGAQGFGGDWLDWADQLPDRSMSPAVRRVLRDGLGELESGRSRYEAMCHTTAKLVSLGAQRQRGVPSALNEIIDAYVLAVDGERDRDPQAELGRAIQGAVSKFGGRRRHLR